MPPEALLPILPEPIRRRIHDDLIIPALETNALPRGVRRRRRERVHIRLCDEFYRHGDIEFPCAERLVVGGGDEAAVLVAEGDGVDGAEVVVVLLGHFAGARVVLDDFLVGHAGEEFVGGGGIEFYNVRDGTGGEAGEAGACFGVPSGRGALPFHLSVAAGAEEGRAGGGEVDV